MSAFPAIKTMVQNAEQHAEAMAKDRLRAVEYHQGVMADTPSDEGRSKMVTKDVRSNIKKVLPSLVRTILGSDTIAEFQPVDEGDDEGAEQATDYFNNVTVYEADVRRTVEDALNDALLLRNGIIKWWREEKQAVKISKHSGLAEDAFAELVSGDDVTVIEHTERMESVDTEQGPVEVPVHDVKIKRTFVERLTRSAAVPRERFLIHSDAVSLQDSPVTGEKTKIARSELVAMGYDREKIDELPIGQEEDEERNARRDNLTDTEQVARANEEIDYYDLYVRIDMDDDGISELRHMCFAGGLSEENLLENDECDEVQFCDIKVMCQPHQWEGISLADDLMDVQRVKTVLLRSTLDNLYWQNNPQRVVQADVIEDMDAVDNPEFGKSITVRNGVDIRAAVGFDNVPFVAGESFGMLEYMDKEAEDRTGVSDASAGLAPDALQNMTAKASAMLEQGGIGQTELMVSTAAEGLKSFFRGLHRLTVRHQDVAKTVRLRGEWVTFDPRQWNAEMDCKVNTGLGAGTRERDMQMMQFVLAMQEKLLLQMGPDNPYVTPENLSASLSKLVESAGLRTPSLYFTEPDPEEVKAKIEAMQNQPSPEQMKIEATKEIESIKAQGQAAKEKAQMEADLIVKQAEIQANTQAQGEKLQSDALMQREKLQFERETFYAELDFKREDAAMRRQDEIHKAQAQAMTQHLQS